MFKGALLASSVAASINVQFDKYLNGVDFITSDVFDAMWEKYETEFTSVMKNKLMVGERKNNF